MTALDLHFEWDNQKAASNFRKHGISFLDASEVFSDPLAIRISDEDHSAEEQRWITLGCVRNQCLVVVAHTWLEDKDNIHIRIISARKATAREIRNYEGE